MSCEEEGVISGHDLKAKKERGHLSLSLALSFLVRTIVVHKETEL